MLGLWHSGIFRSEVTECVFYQVSGLACFQINGGVEVDFAAGRAFRVAQERSARCGLPSGVRRSAGERRDKHCYL